MLGSGAAPAAVSTSVTYVWNAGAKAGDGVRSHFVRPLTIDCLRSTYVSEIE